MNVFYLNQNKETDNVIIFLHIPKTGGNTLNVIINKPYTDNDCLVRLGDVDDLSIEELKQIEMVRGHMSFGIHKKLPQTNSTYITLIRNPIERVVSFYYYMGSENNLDIETRDYFTKLTLYEFVTEPLNDQFNKQTNIIAGNEFIPEKLENKEMLETAKRNLKNFFSVVGITERFDETLIVLQEKFGFKINSFENYNVTPNRPDLEEIPDEIINIIKSKNEIDMDLYQFANQLLDEQLQSIK